MKTIEQNSRLEKLITTKLNTLSGGTYHKRAPNDAAFPYKTYELSRVELQDLSRYDYVLDVDVWDKHPDAKRIEDIADAAEDLFNASNLPQTNILPTFFRESRISIDDPDKDIQHIRLTFSVQLYKNL